MPCSLAGDRIVCPAPGNSSLHRQLVEVDQKLREALLTEPVAGAVVVIDFPAVPLGRALVIATGLHDTWMRKAARGTVEARLTVGDQTTELPVTSEHAVSVDTLPPIHKDPFDRLLLAQALVEGITLLTADAQLARYRGPVRRV